MHPRATTAMQRSCENKAEVVAQDEREGGVRATLNLGHTFGHAVETGLGYGEWLHGEAVSVGTVMAVDMSKRLGWIDDELADRATALLKRANLPVALPEGCPLTVDDFRNTMAIDKKVTSKRRRAARVCLVSWLSLCSARSFESSRVREFACVATF